MSFKQFKISTLVNVRLCNTKDLAQLTCNSSLEVILEDVVLQRFEDLRRRCRGFTRRSMETTDMIREGKAKAANILRMLRMLSGVKMTTKLWLLGE
jgi:hypothetical protein